MKTRQYVAPPCSPSPVPPIGGCVVCVACLCFLAYFFTLLLLCPEPKKFTALYCGVVSWRVHVCCRGLDDLRAGIIRTPLSPMVTFQDDPLRVLRALRFASRFGFTLHEVGWHFVVCVGVAELKRREAFEVILASRMKAELYTNMYKDLLATASEHFPSPSSITTNS